MIQLGIKTDPIHTRYTYDWLFDLLVEEEISYIQLGAFFEMFHMDDDSYFLELKTKAESRGLRIKSMFSAYREFGGFFYDHPQMEKASRRMFEKFIHIAGVLGVDYVGTNPGAVYRDQMHKKEKGIETYLKHMKELQQLAHAKSLKALTIEPMSCMAEPPTTPQEMDDMIGTLNQWHQQNKQSTVPVWLCGDISHGLANENRKVLHSSLSLFEHGIPMMCEFHFKNTDQIFESTFGFSEKECQKGIIDLVDVKSICKRNGKAWPVEEVIGYLELSGPKTGRDYTDPLLGDELRTSLRALKRHFAEVSISHT